MVSGSSFFCVNVEKALIMENRAHALAAGLFVVLLGLGLIAAAIWFTGDTEERVGYLLVSKVPVSGLNPKAPVHLRGVNVGKVDEIRFDPKDPRTVLIDIAVDSAAPITKGTYAQLAYQGVTGLSFVQLDDDGSNLERLPTSDAAPGRIDVRPSLLDQVGNSSQQLLADAGQTAKRIHMLLSDQNVAQLSRTLANLEVASGRIAAIATDLQPSVKALPALANRAGRTLQHSDSLVANLDGLTADVRQRIDVLDRLSRGADKVSRSADAVEHASTALENELLNRALPRLYGAIDDLSHSSHAFDQVLADLHDHPQSLIFGRRPAPPGPGEPGFSAVQGTR
jgi:phospholipid/cholesterol/gamma-HCH transport system substrate-binding protein